MAAAQLRQVDLKWSLSRSGRLRRAKFGKSSSAVERTSSLLLVDRIPSRRAPLHPGAWALSVNRPSGVPDAATFIEQFCLAVRIA